MDTLIKRHWTDIVRGAKPADAPMTKEALFREGLLSLAIMAYGALAAAGVKTDTPDQFLDTLRQTASVQTPVGSVVERIAKALPGVSRAEMLALNNPIKTPSWEFFTKTLSNKVKDGLKPGSKVNAELSEMSESDKSDMVFNAFKMKVENSREKVDLDKYLSKVGKTLKDVLAVAKSEIGRNMPGTPVAVRS